MYTLPACPNADFARNVSSIMQRPIINDLGVVLLVGPLLAVDDQVDDGEVHVDGVVMPLVVTNLRQFPSPFCGSESVFFTF